MINKSGDRSESAGRAAAQRVARGQSMSYIQMLQRESLAIAILGMDEYDAAYYDELSKIALETAKKVGLR